MSKVSSSFSFFLGISCCLFLSASPKQFKELTVEKIHLVHESGRMMGYFGPGLQGNPRFSLFDHENNERIVHACGTCRFGSDPRDSVLNANNRAHGLSNLYVVDASFFPSSGGSNPALTIAANALRVADHLTATRAGTQEAPKP